MDKWTHCRRAKEDADKINEMIAENHGDRELEFENLHEAMVCAIYDMMLCKHEMKIADTEDWKDYNREMYDATYPEDKQLCDVWVKEVGEHWTITQTTSVAKQHNIDFSKFDEKQFWCVMNVAYSDHHKTFADNIKTYVDFSYDWLCDVDSYTPQEKLERYYKYIVKH